MVLGVITDQNMRGYVVFTSDPAATEAKLKALGPQVAPYELRFKISEDREWRAYTKYFGGGKK